MNSLIFVSYVVSALLLPLLGIAVCSQHKTTAKSTTTTHVRTSNKITSKRPSDRNPSTSAAPDADATQMGATVSTNLQTAQEVMINAQLQAELAAAKRISEAKKSKEKMSPNKFDTHAASEFVPTPTGAHPMIVSRYVGKSH
ncbi:hypothetical protein M3Y94_00758400 [Aphelenchoides besseyi]|nr:hypothetical protein M3Y94_00758400 [Aphelenchoides besseyi]KAI6232142.1 hypothetical protein M3Y95_00455600 [Aphelenchoides besseyi]